MYTSGFRHDKVSTGFGSDSTESDASSGRNVQSHGQITNVTISGSAVQTSQEASKRPCATTSNDGQSSVPASSAVTTATGSTLNVQQIEKTAVESSRHVTKM